MRKFMPAAESVAETKPQGEVFLGGTINGSTWRDRFIPLLKVSYFNPVVEGWTIEDREREEQAKAAAKVLLFVITPRQKGFYAVVEAAVAAAQYNAHKKVVLVFEGSDEGVSWEAHQADSLMAVENLLLKNYSVFIAEDMQEAADYINKFLAGEAELPAGVTL